MTSQKQDIQKNEFLSPALVREVAILYSKFKSRTEIASELKVSIHKIGRVFHEGYIQKRERKGKTFEEIYGKEKAIRSLEKNRRTRKENPTIWSESRRIRMSKLMSNENNPMFGVRLTGEKNPFFGKKHTEETKGMLEEKLYSRLRNRNFEEVYGKDKAKEIKEKALEGLIKFNSDPRKVENRGYKISTTKKRLISEGKLNPMKGMVRHSKPEKILKEIIEKNNLPFNYVGDGSIWFKGENHNFNPDFLSKNPKHIIEVFGDYWHNLEKNKYKDRERLDTYSRYGYKTLIIWEHEIINRNGIRLDENPIIDKIKSFIT